MGRRNGKKEKRMPAVVWIVGALLILAIMALPTWLMYSTVWLPRAKTREFLAILAKGDISQVRDCMSPETRGSSTDATVRTWIEAAQGHEDVDWGNKSKMGTTRGGRTMVSTQGYLRYPGTPKERWFSISLVKEEGELYVAAFSVGSLEKPR
jgi:hypothetical protein